MKKNGFSLVEIAVVLVIISVLIAIVAVPLATQIEQRRTEATLKQLEVIKEALIGFATAKGRLPCPATLNSAGLESFCTSATGACVWTTTEQAHGRGSLHAQPMSASSLKVAIPMFPVASPAGSIG